MILPIIKEPNPILHRKAELVREMTDPTQRLITDMIETMHVAEGVGLAANQVGSPLNILVASPDGMKGKELVLINATLVRQKGRAHRPEGCLSLPGIASKLNRSAEVTVTALGRTFKTTTLDATGLLAQILQHEIDHLQGHLYVDRLAFWSRWKLLRKYRSLAESLSRIDL